MVLTKETVQMAWLRRGRCRAGVWLVGALGLVYVAVGSVKRMSRASLAEVEARELRARLQGPMAPDDPQLTTILRQEYLAPPSLKPYNLTQDPLSRKLRTYGSWVFIYPQIKSLFGDQRGGFFVEAGALDGERLSNTLWLEQELGWTGLLIEPNPANYKNLVSKNRKAWTSQSCLSSRPYPKEEVFVSLSRKAKKESELSHQVYDSHGASHVLGVTLDSTLYDGLLQESDKSYSVVQCFPLVSYLLALNTTTVDLLSLDIQGAERAVLRGIPWGRVEVRVVVVEVVHRESFDESFVEYMGAQDFILVYFRGEDYVFVRRGDPLMGRVKGVTLVMNRPTDGATARGPDQDS